MEVCVEKGKVIEKVGSDCKSIYEYFSEDEEFMASLRDDIECILKMDDDEVRRTLDTLAELKRWIDEHDARELVVEPGYSSLYRLYDGGVYVDKREWDFGAWVWEDWI